MERRIELPRVLSTFDEESLKLYSLVHYAGIMIDPSLFKNILDLLKADVHPDAILKVLSDASERSPFGDPKNQAKIERHVARRRTREEQGDQNTVPSASTIIRDRDRYGSRENLRPPRETRSTSNRRSTSKQRRRVEESSPR